MKFTSSTTCEYLWNFCIICSKNLHSKIKNEFNYKQVVWYFYHWEIFSNPTIWYRTISYNKVLYHIIQHCIKNILSYSMIQYCIIWYDIMINDTFSYHLTIWYDTIYLLMIYDILSYDMIQYCMEWYDIAVSFTISQFIINLL